MGPNDSRHCYHIRYQCDEGIGPINKKTRFGGFFDNNNTTTELEPFGRDQQELI